MQKLKGREGYRIRVNDYRIIYEIFDSTLLVDVIDLGHRKIFMSKFKSQLFLSIGVPTRRHSS